MRYSTSTLIRGLCALSLTAATAWLAAPTAAQACGGTFCDAGPQAMPVDQTGENILFVMEDGWVEAHIQIQYSGNPEQFAWVVPVMALPEIEVGSDPLFTSMLGATAPTFVLNTRSEDNCMTSSGSGLGCSAEDLAASFDGEGGEFEDDDPNVLRKDTVGAFEYAVLEGGTVQGVTQWLDDNGYAQDDEAPEILAEYLDEGFLFVAFKLQAGAGLDEIHPVTVRYEGDEPCVPIRLTRIAAEDDMGIRTFFLGDARVVPTNFRHVELNPLKFDWLNLGANYLDVVTQAVDEQAADGHAFITEYAGPSEVIQTGLLHSEAWNSASFAEIEPAALSDTLRAQGLLTCSFDVLCGPNHPLLEGLLNTYFPAPDGVDEQAFYDCSSCFADQVDPERWDPTGFAAAFEERIVGPGEHALDILEHPYLTRLFTTLSAGEMTRDPLFHENPELPGVSNQWTATQVIDCEGPDRLELPDGQELIFDDDDLPPTFDDMPFATRIEEIARMGAPIALVDNQDAIDGMLADWNRAHDARGGCDCQASRRHFNGALPLGVMLLLGLRARRRRR